MTYQSNLPNLVSRALNSFKIHFDVAKGFVEDAVLKASHERSFFISAKQVPSALTMRHAGSSSVKANKALLLEYGFTLEQQTSEGWVKYFPTEDDLVEELRPPSQFSGISSYLSSIHQQNNVTHRMTGVDRFEVEPVSFEEVMPGPTPSCASEEEDDFDMDDPNFVDYHRVPKPDYHGPMRIVYTDPFLIMAAVDYATRVGRTPPKVRVWEGDVVRLSDKIPKRLLGPDWNGRGKGGVPFYDIKNMNVKLHVLKNGTHWGYALNAIAVDRGHEICSWARSFWKKITYFLKGKHNPGWTSSQIVSFYGRRDYERRSEKSRASRLLQVLMTVDGIFQQRFLACPEEVWTWERFDMFTLGNLFVLLDDEFFDGEATDGTLTMDTAYDALKRCRKQFKERANNRSPTPEPLGFWDKQFYRLYKFHEEIKDEYHELLVRGILVQTRGAGTPPPLVSAKAKMKLIKTLMLDVTPRSKTQDAIVRNATMKIVQSIPDDALTGLQTKAGVRAATSSCYEHTRMEGGSAQAIQDIVRDGYLLNRKCTIFDLENGGTVGEKFLHECTPGEYIFWSCLEEVLSTPPEELTKVFLVVVSEPGKPRGVTKGPVALKVVLDVVSSICAWPLKKGLDSSVSGMGKDSHGWNFFRDFFRGDAADIVFREQEVTVEQSSPTEYYHTRRYADAFVSSTDYTTATDFVDHRVAKIIGTAWMLKCGIPPLLRGIVNRVCFSPRWVEFKAKGPFSNLGDPGEQDDTRKIKTKRGILMGDPLTKVILHLINAGVRAASASIQDYGWVSEFASNAENVTGKIMQPTADLPRVVRKM